MLGLEIRYGVVGLPFNLQMWGLQVLLFHFIWIAWVFTRAEYLQGWCLALPLKWWNSVNNLLSFQLMDNVKSLWSSCWNCRYSNLLFVSDYLNSCWLQSNATQLPYGFRLLRWIWTTASFREWDQCGLYVCSSESCILQAFHEGKCIGTIVCKMGQHRNTFRGYIAMLVVVKQHRGKGIGKHINIPNHQHIWVLHLLHVRYWLELGELSSE